MSVETRKPFKNTAKECPRCNHNKFKIGAGKGPHKACLCCAKCNRFMWWLQKAEYNHLANH